MANRTAETKSKRSHRIRPHAAYPQGLVRRRTHNAWRRSVNTILVVGVDSVVGANVAAALCEKHRIIGLPLSSAVSISDCTCLPVDSAAAGRAADYIALHRPAQVCYCGHEAL